jgi:cysteine synthase A
MTSANRIHASIFERIGGTPLIELRHLVPEGRARILIKLESQNPTGSMKDRMGLVMVEAAERDGRLQPGGRVVEYTGGSTGVSLALVCTVKGYPLSIVTSDAFSQEKRNHMAALGVELTIVRSVGGGMDAALTRNMIEAARQITERTGGGLDRSAQQRRSALGLPPHGRGDLGADWRACGCFRAEHRHGGLGARRVRGAPRLQARRSNDRRGTRGVGGAVRRSDRHSQDRGRGIRLRGSALGSVVITEIAKVSTEGAMAMARRLATVEALFAGTSTGANLVAALDVAARLGPTATVVTVMCDSGIKYLSTALYKDAATNVREWEGQHA